MNREQRRALKYVGVGCSGHLVLLVLLSACAMLLASGPEEVEEAAAPEETTEAQPDAPPDLPSKPPASDLENRIRYNMSGGLDLEGSGETISVEAGRSGCQRVRVEYQTPFEGSGIRDIPSVYYKAVYGDPELRETVCRVETHAYGELTDEYGQITKEMFLSTSMNAETARRVNWNNSASVDFGRIYTVDYLHPTVRQNIEREAAEQAVDCADDGGLGDFEWAECP